MSKRDEKEEYRFYCISVIERYLDSFMQPFTKTYEHKNIEETYQYFAEKSMQWSWTIPEIIFHWYTFSYWKEKFKELMVKYKR